MSNQKNGPLLQIWYMKEKKSIVRALSEENYTSLEDHSRRMQTSVLKSSMW